MKTTRAKPYRIYFSNFGYYSSEEGRTLEDAKRIASEKGFECRIEFWPTSSELDAETIGAWSVLGGYRDLTKPWGRVSTDPNAPSLWRND